MAPLNLGNFGAGWSPFMKSKSRSSSVIPKMSRENYERWPSHTRLFASGSSTAIERTLSLATELRGEKENESPLSFLCSEWNSVSVFSSRISPLKAKKERRKADQSQ
jgi:hypothetical protein